MTGGLAYFKGLTSSSRFRGVLPHAPDRSNIPASLLSLVRFNRGMLLLRLGRLDDARRALALAHAIEPLDEALDEATWLAAHDQHAREIAARVRSKPLVAA